MTWISEDPSGQLRSSAAMLTAGVHPANELKWSGHFAFYSGSSPSNVNASIARLFTVRKQRNVRHGNDVTISIGNSVCCVTRRRGNPAQPPRNTRINASKATNTASTQLVNNYLTVEEHYEAVPRFICVKAGVLATKVRGCKPKTTDSSVTLTHWQR